MTLRISGLAYKVEYAYYFGNFKFEHFRNQPLFLRESHYCKANILIAEVIMIIKICCVVSFN